MTDIIPFFAALITLLFSLGFLLILRSVKSNK